MLVIPLKVTDTFDIAPPLAAWIENGGKEGKTNSNVNGGGTAALKASPAADSSSGQFREELLRLASLRNTISDAICSSSSHESVASSGGGTSSRSLISVGSDASGTPSILKDMKEYHASLTLMEQRGFPVSDEDLPKNTEVNGSGDASGKSKATEGKVGGGIPGFKVSWRCALERSRGGSSNAGGSSRIRSNIRYERGAILYNIGSMESYLATSEDTTKLEGLVRAAKKFNTAAGIFHHLRTDVTLIHDVNATLDLTPMALEMCEQLLLAQGQACMYDMARLKPRPMNSVLSKLAAGCANLYESALKSMQSPSMVRRMTDAPSWTAYVKCLMQLWRGRAEYHESLVLGERARKMGRGYGMEIARLTVAEALCEQALLFGKDLRDLVLHGPTTKTGSEGDEDGGSGSTKSTAGGGPVLRQVESLKATVLQRKAEAEKDNQQVYHEPVPKARDLQPIQGRCLSKVLPLDASLTPSSLTKPLFAGLLSSSAQRAYTLYSNEVDDIVSNCTRMASSESEGARRTLASVDLPQSLSAFTTREGLPNALWQKIETLGGGEFIELLKGKLWELKDTAEIVRSSVKSITSDLDNDVKLDEEFRAAHPLFRGKPPLEEQASVRKDLKHYNGLLDNAKNGDCVLLKMLEVFENDSKFKLLGMQKEQLNQLIPTATVGVSFDTRKLSSLLRELSKLLRERDGLINRLRELKTTSDVREMLSSAKTTSTESEYEVIIRRALLPFQSLKDDVADNVGRQPELLHRILAENAVFDEARKSDSVSLRREKVIMAVEEALREVTTVDRQVSEGRNFYNSIMPRLEKLKHQGGDVIMKCALERIEFEDREHIIQDRRRQELEDEKYAAEIARKAEEEYKSSAGSARTGTGSRGNSPPPYGSLRGGASSEGGDADAPKPAPSTTSDSLDKSLLERPDSATKAGSGASSGSPKVGASGDSGASPTNNSSRRSSGSYVPPILNPPSPPSMPSSPEPRSPSLASSPPATGNSGSSGAASSSSASANVPGVYPVSNYEKPPTRVDDEKVASLVEMNFDPDLAVEALARHDNNLENAVNDLITRLQC